MKNSMIKIGTVVPKLKVADVKYNTNTIIEAIKENNDCGILVFPELCISAYTCADLFQNDALLDGCEKALLEIAEETKSISSTIVVGAPLRYHNTLYNCAVFLSNGTFLAVIPKINIPNYSEFYEDRWFQTGRNIKNCEISIGNNKVPFGVNYLLEDEQNGAVLSAEICEDLWVADKPSTHACLAGANIIVNLSASDEVIGKQEYRRSMVSQQSSSCYCAYAYVSSGMDESSTDLVFSAHSMIYQNGVQLADSIFTEGTHVETALIDLSTIRYNRIHQNTFGNEEGYVKLPAKIPCVCQKNEISTDEMYEILKKENYFIPRNPFVPSEELERTDRCKKILQIQAHGLATRVRATGITNLVIGISGGLDSTLALIVAYEAQKIEPKIHIIAYTLPNHGNTTSMTYNNAVELMKALHVEIREVAIEKGVNLHLEELGHGTGYQGEGDTTYENAQARYRTYILMDAANMENGLVVGTGDLSELALGWCTYNGDHMSMYAVNASVPKTLVSYICRTYAEMCGNPVLHDVLIRIVETPISPELTPSKHGQIAQKTEEKIGKYDLNDFFLFYMLRYGFAPEKILSFAMCAFPEVTKEDIKNALIRFYNRFFHQQFKRSCLPDGPKVGSVTLSPRGDWRMPSDASCQLWIEEVKKA